MAIIVSDTFTVASDTELSLHTPDTGSPWELEENVGTATTLQCVASTDRLGASTLANSSRIIYTSRPNPSSVDYDIQITQATTMAAAADDTWFMVARMTDVSNYYSAGCYNGAAAADKKIFKKVADVVTELASGDSGSASGVVYKFEIRDAAKKLFKDSVEALSTADNALTIAGRAGFGMGNAWGVTIDDVNNTIGFDDYSVDEIAGAATTSLPASQMRPAIMHMLVR